MKEINLTQGLVAKVDDKDYQYLNQFKWFARRSGNVFYAERIVTRMGVRQEIFMHNAIMQPQKGLFVDHIDRNGINCQRHNMRICTRSQNNMNRIAWGQSKYKGVSYNDGKIRARIRLNKKLINLGNFKTEKDAAIAYNNAAKKYFGEFANLNII